MSNQLVPGSTGPRDEALVALVFDYTRGAVRRREFISRGAAAGFSLATLSGLLAACGGDDAGSATATTDAAAIQRGGTYREGYDLTFQKLDNVKGPYADEPFYALYEFALARDLDGNPTPSLASGWDVSQDGKTVTLQIRDGLAFHSGAPCTAKDVARAFELQRTEGVNVAFLGNVEQFVAGSGNTVEIRLKHPWYGLFDVMSTPWMMVHNEAARRRAGDGWGATTVDGTGPFTLTRFDPAKEVVASRWADYPGSGIPFISNRGPAYLDEIRWMPILEESNRVLELQSGSIDAVRRPAPQDVEGLKQDSSISVLEFPELGNLFLSLNWTRTDVGFDQVAVHQAISHAIDREALVRSIYFGHAVATYGPLYPSFRWYEQGVEEFNQYDPEKARQLLADAGVGDISFTVVTQPIGIQQKALEAVAGMLSEVGVTMKIQALEDVEFFPRLGDSDAFMFKWLFDAEIDAIRFFGVFPTPEYYGSLPEAHEALDQWENAQTEEEAEAAARSVQLAWAETLPFIPLLTPNMIWAHRKEVHGLTPRQTMIYPFYNDVWLER